uniref:NXF1/2/3/5-like leucine-rich repeat domain-containing protein n=1 Tax=Glossina palpalis gambiensis TaxID=67801 RepID=A0A1B0B6F3_9MUSC
MNTLSPNVCSLSMRVNGKCIAVSIDEEFKERVQLVTAKRYNPHTKLLDIVSAALDAIEKHTPDLEALNLNQNHLSELDSFEIIEQRLPYLKIIYLADNDIARLMVLRNTPVTELILETIPSLQRYKDHSSYVAALVKPDGEKLQTQIVFDVNGIFTLPREKALFLCDTYGGNVICPT